MVDLLRVPRRLLLHDVEVAGRRVDVTGDGGVVTHLAARSRGPAARAGVEVIDGRGCALLPGLADHHLHLLAAAASRDSVDCDVPDRAALGAALRAAPGDRVRGVGYHDDVAGPLDRCALDALEPDRPVRVQHRSGARWTLNTRALQELAVGPADLVGDGWLWRADPRLAPGTQRWPDLAGLGDELAGLGVLAVTEATPDLDAAALGHLAGAGLPQQVLLLGAQDGWSSPNRDLRVGPRKILLHDEHDLDWTGLLAAIGQAHAAGRPVALHTVTRGSLVAVLAALAQVGTVAGDRLEHAAVVPGPLLAEIARLGLLVVTQPALAVGRGDHYLRAVDPADVTGLWRWGSLRAAGIAVVGSSDAPYGPMDPWVMLRAARDRTTPAGRVLGSAERVPVEVALRGLLTPLADPGGPVRTVHVGAPADLVLLGAPLAAALADPCRDLVRTVVSAR